MSTHRAPRRLLGGAGAVALPVVLVVFRDDVVASVSTVLNLDRVWLLPLLATQLASMAAPALVHHRLLRRRGVDASRRSLLGVVFASNAMSVSLPLAGPEIATAYTFRQFQRRGAFPAVAAWALLVSGVASTFALAALVALGTVATGSPTTAVVGLGVAALAVLGTTLGLRTLRTPAGRARVERVVAWARRGRATGDSVEVFLRRLVDHRLRGRDTVAVGAWSLTNWLADCLCLAVAVAAVHGTVSWVGVLLSFVAGTGAAGLRATPGGIGVVEAAMTGALVGAGMSAATALAAVLLYRLVSFWLVLAAGWVVFLADAPRGSASPKQDGPVLVSAA